MAIFNLKSIKSSDSPFRTRYFNELQVNGEDVNDTDDFTIDDDESEDNESTNTGEETADTGENTPEDAAQDAAENPSEEDNQAAEDLGADTTDDEDDSSTADDNEAPATEENTETTDTTSDDDFTMDDTDQSEGEANTEDSGDTAPAEGENNPEGGGEDTATDDTGADDFTMDDSQGGGDPAGGEDEAGTTDDGTGTDDTTADSGSTTEALPADPSDNISDEDVKAAEEQIYDSLTDDQKRIRVLQLKIDYKDLYETIITTKEGINSIPKTMENLDTIKRLTLFTEKTKGILIDYIQNNFDKNPYLENYAMYIKFMAVFRTISKVIEELNAAHK